MSSADEILDVVDENDEVVGQARRGDVYTQGMRHRCAFIQVRDAQGRLFVHRRTPTKLVFPSLYDMFVGGVVGAGETYDEAALREAEEELGVSGFPARPFSSSSCTTTGPESPGGRRCTRCSASCRSSPQVEEVAWHGFLPEAEVRRRLTEWEWVPDGLAAYSRLRALRERG